jgi:hypothetical protein
MSLCLKYKIVFKKLNHRIILRKQENREYRK